MRQLIERHLDLFGDRCLEELKLEAVPFRDEPKKLLALVQTYSSSDVKVDEMVAKEHAIRDQATVVVNKALRFKPLYSLWFRWALAMARRSVRYRESSRLDRARSFGIVRSLFRQMGKNFAEEGAIEDSEDIFYLTVEEVLGFVAGSSVNKSLRWLIDERKKTESTYEATQPADRIRTQGTTYLNTVPPRYPAHLRVPAMDGSLEGVGCSAGVVTAEAVVVNDPKTVKNIEGKILIAQMTDPGWVFLMISAAGLVVEKGSLLSHTAIIGRELGVPTVVGLPSATVRIKTGDIIKVNGQTGIVEMVTPANSEDA
jgi:pyruvate,water dikinase